MISDRHAKASPPFTGSGKVVLAPDWKLQQECCPAPTITGELEPALWRDGPIPPQAREGNPDAMGIGKQDLPFCLKRVTPVVQNGQLSYHLGPQPGLTLAHLNIYTI